MELKIKIRTNYPTAIFLLGIIVTHAASNNHKSHIYTSSKITGMCSDPCGNLLILYPLVSIHTLHKESKVLEEYGVKLRYMRRGDTNAVNRYTLQIGLEIQYTLTDNSEVLP